MKGGGRRAEGGTAAPSVADESGVLWTGVSLAAGPFPSPDPGPISSRAVHSSTLADGRIPNDTGALPGHPTARRSLDTGHARAAFCSRPTPTNRDLQVWATRDFGRGAAAYAVALAGRRHLPPMARLLRSAWRVADQAPVRSSLGSRMS